MALFQPNISRLAARGDRKGLVKLLGSSEGDTRLAAAEALVCDSLTADEVSALGPVLLGAARAGSDEATDLALNLVAAFARARWRTALPVLADLRADVAGPERLRNAAADALEVIQPGFGDPACQAPDSPHELEPRVVMEKGLLARGGLAALRDYLERMPLCGVFSTLEMPRTRREENLRLGRRKFQDRRLAAEADFSGTLEETSKAVIDGLYAVAEELGRKRQVSEQAVIQPCRRGGMPGLSEVRTAFGIGLAFEDLVVRGDRDWFYYWGTEG